MTGRQTTRTVLPPPRMVRMSRLAVPGPPVLPTAPVAGLRRTWGRGNPNLSPFLLLLFRNLALPILSNLTLQNPLLPILSNLTLQNPSPLRLRPFRSPWPQFPGFRGLIPMTPRPAGSPWKRGVRLREDQPGPSPEGGGGQAHGQPDHPGPSQGPGRIGIGDGRAGGI